MKASLKRARPRNIAIISTYILLPFVTWGFSRAYTEWKISKFNQSVQRIKISKLPNNVPATLLVQSSQFEPSQISCVKSVIIDRWKGPSDRPVWNSESMLLPKRYLLLRTGHWSIFYKKGTPEARGGKPFELRIIDGDSSTLVGLSYPAPFRRPFFPPLLTSWGWFTGPNGIKSDEVSRDFSEFLQPLREKCNKQLSAATQ